MLTRDFVELALRRVQLLLILRAHHLVVEVEEPLYLWDLFDLEIRQAQE